EQTDGAAHGSDPAHSLFASGTTNLIPADTPLFQRTFTNVPIDAGAGPAQNTWSAFGRVDHQISETTTLSLRHAWYRQNFFTGFGGDSPFTQFSGSGQLSQPECQHHSHSRLQSENVQRESHYVQPH